MRWRLPRIGDIVRFYQPELLLIEEVARLRWEQARKDKAIQRAVENPKSGDSVFLRERAGFAAELGWWKLSNTWPDLRIGVRTWYDAELPGGVCVEVKWIKVRTHHLTCENSPERSDDGRPYIFAQMQGAFPGELTYRGCMLSTKLITKDHFGNELFDDGVYAATHNELRELDDLYKEVTGHDWPFPK